MSLDEFSFTSISGKPVALTAYRGRVLLIVNTASKCGFTPQYAGLEGLHRAYVERGLTVIGFPSGQFNDQELGTDSEIDEFCTVRYGVTFPLSQKVEVRGQGAIPLFRYLTSQAGFAGFGKGPKALMLKALAKRLYGKDAADDEIKWNFTKFLIDRVGNVVARYESPVEPAAIAPDIERLL
jgi:glutathione peroxidase